MCVGVCVCVLERERERERKCRRFVCVGVCTCVMTKGVRVRNQRREIQQMACLLFSAQVESNSHVVIKGYYAFGEGI